MIFKGTRSAGPHSYTYTKSENSYNWCRVEQASCSRGWPESCARAGRPDHKKVTLCSTRIVTVPAIYCMSPLLQFKDYITRLSKLAKRHKKLGNITVQVRQRSPVSRCAHSNSILRASSAAWVCPPGIDSASCVNLLVLSIICSNLTRRAELYIQ